MRAKKPPKELWATATPGGKVWFVSASERTARRGLVKGDVVLRYVLAPVRKLPTQQPPTRTVAARGRKRK